MGKNIVTDTSQKTYLSIEEFSECTGLSPSTIRRRIADGKIPIWQPGGTGTRLLILNDFLNRESSQINPESREATAPVSRKSREKLAGPVPKWRQKQTKSKQKIQGTKGN